MRNAMVDEQLIARGIHDQRVIAAMRSIPRHMFLPEKERAFAYADYPVAIGEGQTISQPYMVALMSQSLALRSDDNVFEIGTGSGYQTAVLAALTAQVFTVDRLAELSRRAQATLARLKITNVQFLVGDAMEALGSGSGGFDAVLLTAGTPKEPIELLQLLNDGGRLLVPLGPREVQMLTLFTRRKGQIIKEEICRCVFVPLIGKYGWDER